MKSGIGRVRNTTACWVVALLLCGAVVAADPQEQSYAESSAVSALDVIHEQIGKFRGQIKNARMRLTNSVAGMGTGDDGEPATPARVCCTNNLQRLRAGFDEVQRQLGELSRCYESGGNDDAVSAVAFAGQDLDSLRRGAQIFETAANTADAGMGLAGMTRAFNQLLESVEALETCPPEPEAEPTKKSRKRKKKN
ncbi:MAG: hypothetical protein GY716_25035 [bacterium]|nr:hypothetical protein [bacterium]